MSGATAVDRRGALYGSMRSLFAAVLAWGERLVYAGSRDDSLPPKVVRALDDYLAQVRPVCSSCCRCPAVTGRKSSPGRPSSPSASAVKSRWKIS